jgi:hypothetical protein
VDRRIRQRYRREEINRERPAGSLPPSKPPPARIRACLVRRKKPGSGRRWPYQISSPCRCRTLLGGAGQSRQDPVQRVPLPPRQPQGPGMTSVPKSSMAARAHARTERNIARRVLVGTLAALMSFTLTACAPPASRSVPPILLFNGAGTSANDVAAVESGKKCACTDSEVVHPPLHRTVNVCGRARRQAIADGNEVSARNNHQTIGHELRGAHAVQLRRIHRSIVKVVVLQDCDTAPTTA